MNTLSFILEFHPHEGDEEVEAHTLIEVHPVIDGVPFTVGSFDAATVIALGLREYEFDLFTCSCGVAGCAGFNDPVHLTLTDTLVRWHIPSDPYRQRMAAELLPPDETPVVFSFDQAAYRAALAQVEAEILAHEATAGVPCSLAPDDWPDLTKTIATQLANQNEYLTERLAEIQADKARWGTLYDAQVEIAFPGSATYRAWLMSLTRQLAYDSAALDSTMAQLAQELQANPESIEHLVRSMDYHTVSAFSWRVSDVQGDNEVNIQGWPEAKVSLVVSPQ